MIEIVTNSLTYNGNTYLMFQLPIVHVNRKVCNTTSITVFFETNIVNISIFKGYCGPISYQTFTYDMWEIDIGQSTYPNIMYVKFEGR